MRIWSALNRTLLLVGYSRAAAELTRQGYHEQAKQCMLEVAKMK